MIKNDRQYAITQAHLNKFNKALDYFESAQVQKKFDPRALNIQKASIKGIMETLRDELKEYDELKSGRQIGKFIKQLDMAKALPLSLIKARIALNWTQKDLAKRVGTSEQQIQRYESRDYESASLATIRKISEVIRAQLSTAN